MKYSLIISSLFALLLTTAPSSSQADPPKFPDFPDSPSPGGEGGGGDNVPYIPHVDYFLTVPKIKAWMMNGLIHFSFYSSGPIMRYNIIWSRPGKEQTDMRWHDPKTPNDSLEEYVINEEPVWDTDYSFKVQAESKKVERHPDGSIWPYQITPFAETTFRTPPNPAIKDKANMIKKYDSRIVTPKPNQKANPFSDKVDERVRLIPHPIIGR